MREDRYSHEEVEEPTRVAVADDYKMVYTVNGNPQTYMVDEKRGATPYYDHESVLHGVKRVKYE